ncbi:MAG: hypothetical protein MUE85_20820 [Microscillaceae bacterium]|jgi:hypothetical protein|nr:hypothetical protein [Microscillaceae bacterium]
MKKLINLFNQCLLIAVLVAGLQSYGMAQDEITEEDKNQQELRLKEDPKDFAANFIVGGYYYNLAIDPHAETTKMKLVEYIEGGDPYEKKKEAFLKKALPYFENAYAINNSDERVKKVLKDIYQHLGVIKRFRAKPDEINAQLTEKLKTIEFKPIN